MPILEQIYWLIILSVVVASVAWTVTQEEIFREPREFCAEQSKNADTIYKRKFFYVFTCEYCFSHWVTLFFLLLTGFRLLIDDWRGYILAFFAVPWLANQWMSITAVCASASNTKIYRRRSSKKNSKHKAKEETRYAK